MDKRAKYCIAIAAVLLAVFVVALGINFVLTDNWTERGVRGDFIGGHLAAGASLAGTLLFFAALLMQGRELELQREELRESRKVAQEQAKAMKQQTEELERQSRQNQLRDDVEFVRSLVQIRGSHDPVEPMALCRPLWRVAMLRMLARAETDLEGSLAMARLLAVAFADKFKELSAFVSHYIFQEGKWAEPEIQTKILNAIHQAMGKQQISE